MSINFKKIIPIILFMLALLTSGIVQADGKDFTAKSPSNYQTDKHEKTNIIVKYKKGVQGEQIKASLKSKLELSKLSTKRKMKNNNVEQLEVGDDSDVNQIVAELKNNPGVEFAEPDYKLQTNSIEDDSFLKQWALNNNGQALDGQPGIPGVDINALKAWDITTGSSQVVIGVLDTGIDISHPDLADNIYINTKEIPGNGIDDDGNGYIDDVNGWDFANNDNSVYDSGASDTHGTIVSGIIGAEANKIGIRGTAPNVKILPLRFMNENSGYTSDAIEAIEYAKAMGVQIINCSWGSENFSNALKEEMSNSGILFVCSAGNNGMDEASSPIYPACFNLPNIISVAAIDNKGEIASFSNYGNGVDVAAPGAGILSTAPDNSYTTANGTSAAAAYVTGTAALLKSNEPGLTSGNIVARIKNNVVQCDSLTGKTVTGGRVDAYAALTNKSGKPDTDTNPAIHNNPDNTQSDDSLNTAMDVDPNLIQQLHYGEDGVNPVTGNYCRNYTFMTIQFLNGQFGVGQTYNSKFEGNTTILSAGWTFSFEGRIDIDVPHREATATLPNGSIETFYTNNNDGNYYACDSRSQLVKQSDGTYVLTTKDQTSYVYKFYNPDFFYGENIGHLVQIIDKNGNTATIEYDEYYEIITKVSFSNGRSIQLSYNSNSNNYLSSVTEYYQGSPTGRVVNYSYASTGYSSSVVCPGGNTIRFTYDNSYLLKDVRDTSNNLIESITYSEGCTFFDGVEVYQLTDKFGNVQTYSYDFRDYMSTITDSNNRRITKWYDRLFNVIKTQDPEGKVTSADYTGWTTDIPMPQARRGVKIASCTSRLYAIGGYDQTGAFVNSIDMYDIYSHKWVHEGSIPSNRTGFEVVTEGDTLIYLVGGRDSSGNLTGRIDVYDTMDKTWQLITCLPTPRENVQVVTRGSGKLYVLGGHNDSGWLNIIEVYDPNTNTWQTNLPPIPTLRKNFKALNGNANGYIYVMGGCDLTDKLLTEGRRV